MKFLRKITDYFVPHKGNDHKPGLLREEGIAVFLVVLLVAVAFSQSGKIVMKGNVLPASVQSLVLVDLANENRTDNNLPELTLNQTLVLAAQLKADDMAKNSYFAHTSPAGVTPWHWFSEAGYPFLYAGENLAVNYTDSIDVDRAWMQSPAHRANILNGHFTEIGIATSEGMYKGKKTTFVVQMFGSPKGGVVQAAKTAAPAPAQPVAQEVAVSVPLQASEVLGESIEEPEEVDVIYANDTYISVKNTEPAESAEPDAVVVSTDTVTAAPQEMSAGEETTNYTGFSDRVLTNSGHYSKIILSILLGIVSMTLLLMIAIEIRKQHYKNILYGALMVALLLLILVVCGDIFFGSPIVL